MNVHSTDLIGTLSGVITCAPPLYLPPPPLSMTTHLAGGTHQWDCPSYRRRPSGLCPGSPRADTRWTAAGPLLSPPVTSAWAGAGGWSSRALAQSCRTCWGWCLGSVPPSLAQQQPETLKKHSSINEMDIWEHYVKLSALHLEWLMVRKNLF